MKKTLGGVNLMYPMPTVLAGAMVDGKPNFNTIAHVGILNAAPPHHISLSMARMHYTNRGIREHGQFSVNIPSQDLVVETDYCGIVSGKRTDKSKLFDVFFGTLPHAPLISQCPICMECRLDQTVELPTHEVFVGVVVETHCDETVLTGGKVDLAKVRPLLFDMSTRKYWSIGSAVGDAWKVGKALKSRS
jgi:flavin reductase (DIM6/NTAB) family NADH-FMN oxidoreductase RutF